MGRLSNSLPDRQHLGGGRMRSCLPGLLVGTRCIVSRNLPIQSEMQRLALDGTYQALDGRDAAQSHKADESTH